MNEDRISQLNPLSLAFMGDAVYTLKIREYALKAFDLKANKLDAFCRSYVNASAQAKSYREIEGMLTEDELALARRARNSNPANKAKHASIADYMHATALEAVIGYLYLTESTVRLDDVMTASMNAVEQKND